MPPQTKALLDIYTKMGGKNFEGVAADWGVSTKGAAIVPPCDGSTSQWGDSIKCEAGNVVYVSLPAVWPRTTLWFKLPLGREPLAERGGCAARVWVLGRTRWARLGCSLGVRESLTTHPALLVRAAVCTWAWKMPTATTPPPRT